MVYRSSALLFFIFISFLNWTGCRDKVGEQSSPDTDHKNSSGKTIRVDLDMYTPGLVPQGIGEPNKMAQIIADEWEKLHPGKKIKFQLQLQLMGGSQGEWLKTQLLGKIAPEIIQTNAETAWPHADKNWFVPLDEFLERPNPYVPGNQRWMDIFSNQALMNAKRAPNGKLYCISLDIVETGLFYNKDLLHRHGIDKLPETWDEMNQILAKLKKEKVSPLIVAGNLASDWGQDIIFEMLYRDILPDLDLIPTNETAIDYQKHYLEAPEAGFLFTKGFFSCRDPRWREQYRILKEWRENWDPELINMSPDRLFLTQRSAFYWSGSWTIRRMVTDPYVDFDWGIAYIPPMTKETSRFATGSPATVIGGAAMQLHVTNSAIYNDNLEEAIDFLMYLSAPQCIERMASEALLFIPNVKGAIMDERLTPFNEIFKRQYCAIKWLDTFEGYHKKYYRRMMNYYLNDGIDLDEFLKKLENNFAGWVETHKNDSGWDFERMDRIWKEREAVLIRELE